MIEVMESATFKSWFAALRDVQVRARIQARVRRLALGNPGQYRALRGGVCEMKIDYGPGYRVYYTMRGKLLVVLLCAGDKSTQDKDIKAAERIAKDWKE